MSAPDYLKALRAAADCPGSVFDEEIYRVKDEVFSTTGHVCLIVEARLLSEVPRVSSWRRGAPLGALGFEGVRLRKIVTTSTMLSAWGRAGVELVSFYDQCEADARESLGPARMYVAKLGNVLLQRWLGHSVLRHLGEQPVVVEFGPEELSNVLVTGEGWKLMWAPVDRRHLGEDCDDDFPSFEEFQRGRLRPVGEEGS